jgi:hypothetical protein
MTKSPITDRMLERVQQLMMKEKGDKDVDVYDIVDAAPIPTEKEDLIAMYYACSQNCWNEKQNLVMKQMTRLFGNDNDIRRILDDDRKKKKRYILMTIIFVVVLAIGAIYGILNS